MAGQMLGDRYQVERHLGKQTGRWTLLARDIHTQEPVVLKLLFLNEQMEWDDLKLFEREVEILKSLSHPCIPQYLGYFEHELPNTKALVLIQTYVEGRSLEQCLQQGRHFTEPEAKQLAKALLQILIYLHEQQPPIIHRDIKPSNILLANRQLHLVDFGSVKQATSGDTSAFTVVGTYGYMPPEQFSGRAMPASDLYSLGATLVALIAGDHPSSLPHRGSRIDFSQIAGLSPDFCDWLGWIMAPTLEQRAQTATEALQALMQGRQPATLTPTQPTEPPPDTKITLAKDNTRLEIMIPSGFGQVQLTIDRQQIALTTKRLGFQTGRALTAPRHAIQRLEYRQGSTPHLILWADQQPFELGTHSNLSRGELNWLAQELATWLNLPITRTQS